MSAKSMPASPPPTTLEGEILDGRYALTEARSQTGDRQLYSAYDMKTLGQTLLYVWRAQDGSLSFQPVPKLRVVRPPTIKAAKKAPTKAPPPKPRAKRNVVAMAPRPAPVQARPAAPAAIPPPSALVPGLATAATPPPRPQQITIAPPLPRPESIAVAAPPAPKPEPIAVAAPPPPKPEPIAVAAPPPVPAAVVAQPQAPAKEVVAQAAAPAPASKVAAPSAPEPRPRPTRNRLRTGLLEAAWFARGEGMEDEEQQLEELVDYGALQASLETAARQLTPEAYQRYALEQRDRAARKRDDDTPHPSMRLPRLLLGSAL